MYYVPDILRRRRKFGIIWYSLHMLYILNVWHCGLRHHQVGDKESHMQLDDGDH